MIIAFYPGSGGNRYYHWLQGQKNFLEKTTYDKLLFDQKVEYRYPLKDVILPNIPLILTHCLNVPFLRSLWPGHQIHVLLCDPTSALRREWLLAGSHRINDMPNVEENALATIGFHNRYYQEYNVDLKGADTIINIDLDQDDFSIMMRYELSLCTSHVFDKAVQEYKPVVLQEIYSLKGFEGFNSKCLDDAEKIRMRLDQFSPSLCLAKWKQTSLNLQSGMTKSCHLTPLRKIEITDIQNNVTGIHNTAWKKQQRQMMLQGLKPDECKHCWDTEKQAKLSDRHFLSSEGWASKDFGKIVSSNWDDDVTPSYLEVNFGTIDDANNKFTMGCMVDRHYIDTFWQWWPTLYQELVHLKITGDQPILNQNIYRIFDHIMTYPNKNLNLSLASDLAVENQSWETYLSYIKDLTNNHVLNSFIQYVDLNIDFLTVKSIWSRVDEFLEKTSYCGSITFVVGTSNFTNLDTLYTNVLNLRKKYSKTRQRVWVQFQPEQQMFKIQSKDHLAKLQNLLCKMTENRSQVGTNFQGFYDFEIAHLSKILC